MPAKSKKSAAVDIKLDIDEMTSQGLGVGHAVSRLHPKMKVYISGIKNIGLRR